MDGSRVTKSEVEKCTQNFVGKLKGRDNLNDVDIVGRITEK
jgi:hypothetical protein